MALVVADEADAGAAVDGLYPGRAAAARAGGIFQAEEDAAALKVVGDEDIVEDPAGIQQLIGYLQPYLDDPFDAMQRF